MMRRIFAVCAALFLVVPFVSFAAEPELAASAQKQIKDAVDSVRTIVSGQKNALSAEQLDQKIHDVLVPIFDFDQMSRSCLGANWKKATPEQQKEFVATFGQLLASTYLAKIRKNIENSTITYLPTTVKDDRVIVRTIIHNEGTDIAADYRMYQSAGVWKVYDVIIENVGLVTNYRNEFSAELEKGDFGALLGRLKDKSSRAQPGAK